RGSHPYIGRQWKPCAICTSARLGELISLLLKPYGPASPSEVGRKPRIAPSKAIIARPALLLCNSSSRSRLLYATRIQHNAHGNILTVCQKNCLDILPARTNTIRGSLNYHSPFWSR